LRRRPTQGVVLGVGRLSGRFGVVVAAIDLEMDGRQSAE
jgi:hypothetical protein